MKKGRAAIFRHYPFTIVLKDRVVEDSVVHPHRLKIDPGSRVTGLALVQEKTSQVVWAAEIHHRGEQIRQALLKRRVLRKNRRARKCRYRPPRFQNRCRSRGLLAPSLRSRVENTLTWVSRLRRCVPVAAVSVELAKFDTQALQNPEIQGIEYQQGELFGYEVRGYLLEKWSRRCAYCGAEGVPLQVEHIVPKSRGGTNRVSNLTLACRKCNERKGSLTAAEFGYPEVQKQAQTSLRDAAAVNSIRWTLYRALIATGLPVEAGTGGRTKYNRTRLGLPKAHWTDAACVGASGVSVYVPPTLQPLVVRAMGHGRRQRCGTDRYGFPTRHAPKAKKYQGFQTGDIVRATIPRGKYAGTHVGRVSIRFRPCFRLSGIDVHPRHLTIIQQADGYAYKAGTAQADSPAAKDPSGRDLQARPAGGIKWAI